MTLQSKLTSPLLLVSYAHKIAVFFLYPHFYLATPRFRIVLYFAAPSSALKQSPKSLLCLFEAWSVSILRLVVPWNVWKQVLHLIV